MVVDSSVFIEHLRSGDKENTSFAKLNLSKKPYISTIILFEIFAGVNTEHKKAELLEILKDFNIVPFQEIDALKAAEIILKLKKHRKTIEFRDVLIAATAINLNLPLKTLNKKHFAQKEGLELL